MRITQSKIYKAVAPYLSSDDRKEFARMLRLAKEADKFDVVRLNSNSLIAFATWAHTPQGHEYWASLCRRLGDAGSDAGHSVIQEWHNGAAR